MIYFPNKSATEFTNYINFEQLSIKKKRIKAWNYPQNMLLNQSSITSESKCFVFMWLSDESRPFIPVVDVCKSSHQPSPFLIFIEPISPYPKDGRSSTAPMSWHSVMGLFVDEKERETLDLLTPDTHYPHFSSSTRLQTP